MAIFADREVKPSNPGTLNCVACTFWQKDLNPYTIESQYFLQQTFFEFINSKNNNFLVVANHRDLTFLPSGKRRSSVGDSLGSKYFLIMKSIFSNIQKYTK